MATKQLFHQTFYIVRSLVINPTETSPWTALILVFVRITFLSLLLRTYIGPYILRHLSDRVRIRSISLRSVRGLYFREGTRTWRVERIGLSYHRPSSEGARRFSVKIEGLQLDIGKDIARPRKASARPRRHSVLPVLADFAPSPMALKIWTLFSAVYTFLDPYFRPLIRMSAVAFIRLVIRCLPALTQVLDLEIDTAVVSLEALSGAHLVIKGATLYSEVSFTQLERVIGSDIDKDVDQIKQRQRRFLRFTDWRARFTGSVGRAWDRAWGRTQGSASLTLNVKEAFGFTNRFQPFLLTHRTGRSFTGSISSVPTMLDNDATGSLPSNVFACLPNGVNFVASVQFSPKRGTIEEHSVQTSMKLTAVHLAVDSMQSLLLLLKENSPDDDQIWVNSVPDASMSPGLLSPTSPFMETLSASMRFRRNSHPPAVQRLRRTENTRLLALLNRAELHVVTLTLRYTAKPNEEGTVPTFIATSQGISLVAGLSNPKEDAWHRQLLGSHDREGLLDPDAYLLTLAVRESAVERRVIHHFTDPLRLVYVGRIELDVLLSQWPSPWLTHSSLLAGDPNASLLAIRLAVASLKFTERLNFLGQSLKLVSRPTEQQVPPLSLPIILTSPPRVVLHIFVHDISAQILNAHELHGESTAVELRSDGIMVAASSYCQVLSLREKASHISSCPSRLPLQMESSLHCVLEPAFIQLSTSQGRPRRWSMFNPALGSVGEPVVSLASVELTASSSTLGELLDDSRNDIFLDVSSTMTELHCCSDILTIEMWHPSVISSVSRIAQAMTSVSRHSQPSDLSSFTSLIDRLPSGLLVQVSLARLEVFLAGPDIGPHDELELARGVAFRTGFSTQYSSLRTRHVNRHVDRFARTRMRSKLYLPEELLMQAIAVANVSETTRSSFGIIKCVSWGTVLRSSVATRFSSDDMHQSDEDDPALQWGEFLWIQQATIDVTLRSDFSSHAAGAHSVDSFQISIDIPYLRGSFQLVHAYSCLVAMQTLTAFVPERRSQLGRPLFLSHLSVHCKTIVKTIQILWTLPLDQRLCVRCNSFVLETSSENLRRAQWGTLFVWAPAPHEDHKWDELARLRDWTISLAQSSDTSSISVKGEGARLRIPYGYMLSELILDVSVTVKCMRHLTRIIADGKYIPMDIPEAEPAKVVPRLTLEIQSFTLEACDDPFEAKLALIHCAGFEAARIRKERDDAFDVKVATILAADGLGSPSGVLHNYRFTSDHTVSIADAYDRLGQVHTASWVARHRSFKDEQSSREEAILRRLRGDHALHTGVDIPNLVETIMIHRIAPLLRVTLDGLLLDLATPSFALSAVSDFLHEHGQGIPRSTQYSLLVPLHLHFSMKSTLVSLRDYPLPLLHIPIEMRRESPAWKFETDLVFAEELGSDSCVDWVDCPIIGANTGISGASAFSIAVPKTTMPVKTYASPDICVVTSAVTDFSWGVSYNSAIQDVMRVVETLTSPQRDQSPPLGFWDKMRLVFHWRIKVAFRGEVHLHIKGSRDPYMVLGDGAGFAFCWQGNTELTIGHPTPDKELIQVTSDKMLIVVPNLSKLEPDVRARSTTASEANHSKSNRPLKEQAPIASDTRKFQKICAKFTSGVRWGVGIALERSCGPGCHRCKGKDCRFFHFRPHYEVKLEPKKSVPIEKTTDDSFNEFRSDFIHFSVSLASSTVSAADGIRNGIYLTPKTFSHFWSWWALFNSALSLPIRHGPLFPNVRPPSKKFGRHLATLKYRIAIRQLFVSHIYVDGTEESWTEGLTTCVGVKALIDYFQADMHQREQEAVVAGFQPGTVKHVRHRPFYAAEVVLKSVNLRAILATFVEPLKQRLSANSSSGARYERKPFTGSDSSWLDLDDFVELDWSSADGNPDIILTPVAACPHFAYFRRGNIGDTSADSVFTPDDGVPLESSKFGVEDTHTCFLGREASVHQIQVNLVLQRISELRQELACSLERSKEGSDGRSREAESVLMAPDALSSMIALLEDYVIRLRKMDAIAVYDRMPTSPVGPTYHLPSESVSPTDWADFSNVYQVHCPKLFMNNSIRDMLLRYYHCSRSRRGFEYHMATRAVKFIRDQAEAAISKETVGKEEKTRNPATGAQAAALALRKILIGDDRKPSLEEKSLPGNPLRAVDPMSGWSEGVSLDRAHFCLLLKPQIVLQSEATTDSVCILAASQATLQIFSITDLLNADDPVSGRVMTRSYSSLRGLQTFAPTGTCHSEDGCVPLEVLVDLRCQSNDFERLVPQTDATLHYDKFNRLRLRNNVTSVTQVPSQSPDALNSHLQHQTDLIDIDVPRFTVSADGKHFEAISNILTDLLLFSDHTHKVHINKLETLLFRYDFTDLASAAGVVADLQARLRQAVEAEALLQMNVRDIDELVKEDLLKIRAQILFLAEELNLIFDAIKLAQDKAVDIHTDQKSALRLQASSSEISWNMLDSQRELLAKLAVRGIGFSWLSRQDSSTVSHLSISDLQAFDGSPHATWTEILAKYDEPPNHPLIKQNRFVLADWSVLAPVGGITVFERFELNLHPMRLQIDARVGRKIMEYVWPSRRERLRSEELRKVSDLGNLRRSQDEDLEESIPDISLTYTDLAQPSPRSRRSLDSNRLTGAPLRHLGASRSFTDLRKTALDSQRSPVLSRTNSSDALIRSERKRSVQSTVVDGVSDVSRRLDVKKGQGDAAEMKTRSSQKTFILVRVPSLHILLSIMKEESFLCRDARIRTRDLEYRNQTWSFEELVDQFIPSDPSWKGWVRMALQQPLLPVLPVARELWSKTTWIKHSAETDVQGPYDPVAVANSKADSSTSLLWVKKTRSRKTSSQRRWPHVFRKNSASSASILLPLTTEPQAMDPYSDGSPSTSSDQITSRISPRHDESPL